jgi:hypothetical protein
MKIETYIHTKYWYPPAILQVHTAYEMQTWIVCLASMFPAAGPPPPHRGLRLLYNTLRESPEFPVCIQLHPKHNNRYSARIYPIAFTLTIFVLLLRPATLNFVFASSHDISYVLLWNTIPWNLMQAQEYECQLFLAPTYTAGVWKFSVTPQKLTFSGAHLETSVGTVAKLWAGRSKNPRSSVTIVTGFGLDNWYSTPCRQKLFRPWVPSPYPVTSSSTFRPHFRAMASLLPWFRTVVCLRYKHVGPTPNP